MSGAQPVDLTRFGSALILKPSSLGDIVHTLPAVHGLKKAFPRLNLRWLCNDEWTPLLDGNPDLAEVISFPRGRFRSPLALPGILRWVRGFNRAPRETPEIALDFQGLLRTALLAVMRGAKPILGLSDAREGSSWFYRQVAYVKPGMHAVDRYLALAGACGAEVRPEALEWPLPQGAPPARDLPADFILVHPHARGGGKSLSVEALQALCDALAPHGVVIAGRCDAPLPPAGTHVISLVNETSIAQLIWLLRRARAIVSVDSGPMHIAAAVQPERTVGIHTWSDPRLVGPYDARARVWKGGRIAHRADFSDDECSASSEFAAADARRIADVVLQFERR